MLVEAIFSFVDPDSGDVLSAQPAQVVLHPGDGTEPPRLELVEPFVMRVPTEYPRETITFRAYVAVHGADLPAPGKEHGGIELQPGYFDIINITGQEGTQD